MNSEENPEVFYDKFQKQLEASQKWPGLYMFKFIVKSKSGQLEKLKEIFEKEYAENLIKLKKEVVVVSSGSIALGKKQLNLRNNLTLDEKQAAAATGQISLAHAWKEVMLEHGLNVAQILLAPDDTETRRKHLNARATLIKLLELGVIPVINENDTVSTEEIKFGDNDRLAARVAQMCSADLLLFFLKHQIISVYDFIFTSIS